MDSVIVIANKIFANVLNPVIGLLFALAMLYFFWGLFKFISNTADEDGRAEGKRVIVNGLIGMAVMFSVFGIVRLIVNTLEIGDTQGIPQSLK